MSRSHTKTIIAFLLCWSIEMAPAEIVVNSYRFAGATPTPPPLTCTLWVKSTNLAGNPLPQDGYNNKLTQKIHNTSGTTVQICQLDFATDSYASGSVEVSVWSGDNLTGTQYGGTITVSVPASGLVAHSAVWTTSADVPAGVDFYVSLKFISGFGGNIHADFAGDTYETGAGYNITRWNADGGSTPRSDDLGFVLYTLQ